jgi:DNA-binding HxlR family transcriptional regulator
MPSSSSCQIDPLLNILGDHWTLGVIHELSIGPRRTVELFEAFTGLSTKTLTARLKLLKRHGLVARQSYPESPPRVEYSLTDKGRELLPVIRSIAEVARRWSAEGERATSCGKCRACDLIFSEMATGAGHKEPSRSEAQGDGSRLAQNQIIARKRRDVTLL